MGKALFLLVFVTIHSLVTAVLLNFFKPSAGFFATAGKVAGAVFASPIILPLLLNNTERGWVPWWLWVPLNSLVWGVAILGVAAAIKWLWARRVLYDESRH